MCKVYVEAKYLRHKLSADTLHYELLYGIIIPVATCSPTQCLEHVPRRARREAGEMLREKGVARVMLTPREAEEITGEKPMENHYYVLVIDCGHNEL